MRCQESKVALHADTIEKVLTWRWNSLRTACTRADSPPRTVGTALSSPNAASRVGHRRET